MAAREGRERALPRLLTRPSHKRRFTTSISESMRLRWVGAARREQTHNSRAAGAGPGSIHLGRIATCRFAPHGNKLGTAIRSRTSPALPHGSAGTALRWSAIWISYVMPSISIQFHALPEELLALAKAWVSEFGPHVVAIEFPPYEVTEVDSEALDSIFAEGSLVDEVVFTVSRPVLPAEGTLELAEQNPDMLRLMIGGRTAKGVAESHLAAGSDGPRGMGIWKKIGKRLKDLTSLGVFLVHPETGQTGPARGSRFTAGAKALDAKGVAMLSLTGLRMTLIEHDADKGTHSEKL